MALLALSAPSNGVADATLAAGVVLPATETSLAANTGFTFPNNPEDLVVVRIVVGTTATTATFVRTDGSTSPTKALSISTTYIFGPFDPALYSNSSGLVQINMSASTGVSVGAYLLHTTTWNAGHRGLHNPFQLTVGAQDR